MVQCVGKKYKAFMWSKQHRELAVGSWRKKLNADLDYKCHMSHAYFPKITGHRIWDYKIYRRA
jgi:hypothetical protein